MGEFRDQPFAGFSDVATEELTWRLILKREVPSRVACLPAVTRRGWASLNYAPFPNSPLTGSVRMAHRRAAFTRLRR